MRLSRYFLLFLFFCSLNVFAEERQASGFLSGLKQLSATLDQNEQELLPPDQAFKLTVRVRDANTLVAQFEPAKNYYLYKDKVAFKPQDNQTSIEKISLPQGTVKSDVTFGEVEVFHQPFEAQISLKRDASATNKLTLIATYQGCNEPIGVCYAPINKVIELTLPVAKAAAGAVAEAVSGNASAASTSTGIKPGPAEELFQSPAPARY